MFKYIQKIRFIFCNVYTNEKYIFDKIRVFYLYINNYYYFIYILFFFCLIKIMESLKKKGIINKLLLDM